MVEALEQQNPEKLRGLVHCALCKRRASSYFPKGPTFLIRWGYTTSSGEPRGNHCWPCQSVCRGPAALTVQEAVEQMKKEVIFRQNFFMWRRDAELKEELGKAWFVRRPVVFVVVEAAFVDHFWADDSTSNTRPQPLPSADERVLTTSLGHLI